MESQLILKNQFKDVLAWNHSWYLRSSSRMYLPGITADIEEAVQGCTEYQVNLSTPRAAPLCTWSWPTRLWARLHMDYAGPVEGRRFLIPIDAHSKWIEAFCTSTSMSKAVIEELRTTFSWFGLPETIVTDNWTRFVIAEFEAFLGSNSIKHLNLLHIIQQLMVSVSSSS